MLVRFFAPGGARFKRGKTHRDRNRNQVSVMCDTGLSTCRIAGRIRHSSVDGPGVRYVIFFQGCPHHCRGCQNPETWDPGGGTETDLKDILYDLEQTKYLDGVTFSGGDPLIHPLEVRCIADKAHSLGLSVWCYTGWTFEELLAGSAGKKALEALASIDVLVDGPFVQALLSKKCLYRGSSNQRLIDVPASLKEGRAIVKDEHHLS